MTEPPSPPTPRPPDRAAAVARRPTSRSCWPRSCRSLTVAALLLVRPDAADTPTEAPERTELTRVAIVCPGGASQASLSTIVEAGGPVGVRVGKATEETATDLAPRATTTVTGDGAVVVTARDRWPRASWVASSPRPAVAPCRQPASDQWFTGVGAGAGHSSVLELVNPDAGPAVVDGTLIGEDGVVDAPELRGVAVPAGGAVRIDLAD